MELSKQRKATLGTAIGPLVLFLELDFKIYFFEIYCMWIVVLPEYMPVLGQMPLADSKL